MAAKPLTSESIALTEKKMDMTLDDIIKMSKTNDNKPKKQRLSNRGPKFVNAVQDKSAKVQKFMDSRSSLRQGVLARRRSSFQGNQFPFATEAAKKAAAVPIRNRYFNKNRTFNNHKPSRPHFYEIKAWIGTPIVHNSGSGGGFLVKKRVEQAHVAPKQRAQTLDSLFANMKEQRNKVFLKQNGPRRNGGGKAAVVPWARY